MAPKPRETRGKPYDRSRNVTRKVNGKVPSYRVAKRNHVADLLQGITDPQMRARKRKEANNDNMQQQRCDDDRRREAMFKFAKKVAAKTFEEAYDRNIVSEGDAFGRACLGALWVMQKQYSDMKILKAENEEMEKRLKEAGIAEESEETDTEMSESGSEEDEGEGEGEGGVEKIEEVKEEEGSDEEEER